MAAVAGDVAAAADPAFFLPVDFAAFAGAGVPLDESEMPAGMAVTAEGPSATVAAARSACSADRNRAATSSAYPNRMRSAPAAIPSSLRSPLRGSRDDRPAAPLRVANMCAMAGSAKSLAGCHRSGFRRLRPGSDEPVNTTGFESLKCITMNLSWITCPRMAGELLVERRRHLFHQGGEGKPAVPAGQGLPSGESSVGLRHAVGENFAAEVQVLERLQCLLAATEFHDGANITEDLALFRASTATGLQSPYGGLGCGAKLTWKFGGRRLRSGSLNHWCGPAASSI